jgi:hypothetical protein
VIVGDDIYMWPAGGIVRLDLDLGDWIELPDPGFGLGADQWRGMLHDLDGNLVATGIADGDHNTRHTSVWTGTEWAALESLRFNAFSTANQSGVAGGQLFLWSNRHDPTYRYSVSFLMWEEDEGIPRGDSEGPVGALIMGERALVPEFEDSAVYNATRRSWQKVELPGSASVGQMVWTGTEVLAWVDGRDAWRWTPPE